MSFIILVRWLQDIIMILNLLLFVLLFKQQKLDRAEKVIFIYVVIGAAIAGLSIFRVYIKSEFLSWVHQYSILFHFLLFCLFIARLKGPLFRSVAFYAFYVIWGLMLFSLTIISGPQKWMLSTTFCNVGVFVISVKYYTSLFSTRYFFDVKKDFTFWIVTGFFICASVILPIVAFHYFLESKMIYDFITFKSLSAIGAVAFVILHMLIFWAGKSKM